MKNVLFSIISLLIAVSGLSQTVVKNLTTSIAIDGHTEESVWDLNIPIELNYGGSDNTANFGLLWDNNYLYIGIEVEDNLLCNNRRQSFYDDGVEICIDGDHDQSWGFDDNDMQLVKPVRSFWVQEMNLNFDGILHQFQPTENGYTMEIAIPWSSINTSPFAGKQVGFNIVVNDDDDATYIYNLPDQLIWVGGQNYFESPQNWGTIELSNQTTGFSAPYLALISPNNGHYLVPGATTTVEWESFDVSAVNIDYSMDNGSSWETITSNAPASSGAYNWIVNTPGTGPVLIRISDASNAAIADQSDVPSILSETLITTDPLITSDWENYRWPYNAYFPASPNGINGHLGNGCGPSSLARILHSWEFPRQGNGELSFTDYGGYFWSANFGNTIYNYDNMPNYLPENATEPEYMDVATLFLHAQVAMNDYYGTGTDLANMGFAMHEYFNYKESDIAYMHDYSFAEWTQLLMNEIDNGRSVLIQGMNLEYFGDWHTSNGIGGHWYHCDGYNEVGEFHIVVGFGNFQYDGYYKIEEFPLFGYNVGILTGLEPDLEGKTLSLTEPNGGETYTSGGPVTITWESSGIQNLVIEYTMDDGQSWATVINAVNANDQQYTWISPATSSDQCKIRLTDTENINVYDKSDEVFVIQNYALALAAPAGGENVVYGDIALIEWENTPVPEINILFSTDNGTSWTEIESQFPSSELSYEWTVPQTPSSTVLIKIEDSEDDSNFDVCANNFSIVPQTVTGGPYTSDENTLLLLHGEGNFYNQSPLSDHANTTNGTVSFVDNEISGLGKAMYLDNSNGNPYLTVAHNSNLDLSSDWTIELWFKPVSYKQGLQYFIWKPGDNDPYFSNYSLQMNGYWNNELFCFYFSGDDRIGVNSQYVPDLNEWYHVAFIRNTLNGTLKIILRDSQREVINSWINQDNGIVPLTNMQDLNIGFNFDGYIDEIRISDVVRSFEISATEEKQLVDPIRIYPNPASDYLCIDTKENALVQIYSLTGQRVLSTQKTGPGNDIDLSGLQAGIYILSVHTSDQQLNKKLVIGK